MPPVSTTFDTAAEIVLTSPGQFLETETAETLADTAVDLLISGEQLTNPTTAGPVASGAGISLQTLLEGGVDRDFVLPEDNSTPLNRPTQADKMMSRASEQLQAIEDQNYSYEIPQENNIQRNLSGLTPQNIIYSGE